MKVLFFAPKIVYNTYTAPIPLGLLSIASYAEKHNGCEVKIIDRNLTFTDIGKALEEYKPDLVGVSVLSSAVLADAIHISKICHEHGLFVVWGGHFATACHNLVLQEAYVDAVSIGEGEITWSHLITAFAEKKPYETLQGIAYKANGQIVKNPESPYMTADEFPRCNFDLISPRSYFTQWPGICEKLIWIFGAKGCYNQCTFCCNKSFNHQRMRRRNYDQVCDEIKELVAKYGADGIYFGDELWCASKQEMMENCDKISNIGLDFVWGCFLRVDILDREGYQYMYDHGCRWIFFGIESGYQDRLKKVKKGISVANVAEEMRICHEIGILPTCSFMLGFPDETTEELTATAALMKQVSYYTNLDVYYFSPYVGSDLYNELIASGRLEPFKSLEDALCPIWSSLNGEMLKNYSDIPFRELKVIFSCAILWASLNPGKTEKDINRGFFLKTFFIKLNRTVKGLFSLHFADSFRLFIALVRDYAKKYLTALYYVLFFPGIKKKYNLKVFK